jgi:hypothetical protein
VERVHERPEWAAFLAMMAEFHHGRGGCSCGLFSAGAGASAAGPGRFGMLSGRELTVVIPGRFGPENMAPDAGL